jgi:hypothetical protein
MIALTSLLLFEYEVPNIENATTVSESIYLEKSEFVKALDKASLYLESSTVIFTVMLTIVTSPS